MSLKAAKDAMVEAIKTTFNNGSKRLQTVETRSGRFRLEDLKGLGKRTPAVFVSSLTITDIASRPDGYSGMVAYILPVVASDLQGEKREDVAESIATRLAVLAAKNHQNWGVEGLFGSSPVGVDAISVASDEASGVVIWAVSFAQRTRLDEHDFSGLDELLTVQATLDTNGDGTPEAEDTIEVRV